MTAITHYEVYRADSGQWAMFRRFAGSERELAQAEARRIEDQNLPVAIIEETEELSSGQFDVRLVHRSVNAGADIRVPTGGSDVGTRMLVVVLNALIVGAVATVIALVLLSRASLTGTMLKLSLFAAFAGATLLSGLLLFRVYVPVGVILWRAKDAESRRRTVLALTQGRVAASSNSNLAAESPPPAPAPPENTSSADNFQTAVAPPPTIDLPEAPPPTAPVPAAAPPVTAEAPATKEALAAPPAEPAPPAPTVAADAAQVSEEGLAALAAKLKPVLTTFAANCLSTLAHTRPNLSPMDRFGLHLYLLGAARTAADRNGLDAQAARLLLESVLDGARVPPQDVAAFFAELETAGDRPSYSRMMDDGKAALEAAAFGEVPVAPLPTVTEVLIRWSDPTARGKDPQQVTFLLTDMVGSTAMTSALGNAGAQRVVRAHNAVARAAAKAFRGREVKHTGDGMLLIFPDSTSGARAAIDIQQEATAYANDNPTAPLSLRVSVHTGEAVLEDGEYYGPAVTIVGGLCGLVNTGEICCSAIIREKTPSSFRFEDLGPANVKGATAPIAILKLLWQPKRDNKKSVLEYRQIGTTTPPALAEDGPPAGSK